MNIDNLMDLPKKEKFGYYQVGDRDFVSKLQAIEYNAQNQFGLKWCFNDKIFQSWDWKQEPIQSLQELYCQRATRIRDNYDYIVVWYSGGADSHNVLCSFVNHGIHVDEVAVMHYGEADKDNSYWTGEVELTALPDIKKLQQMLPNTHFRYIDISRMLGKLYQGNDRFDWIYHINCSLSPNNYLHSFIRDLDPHYQQIIASGKKMGFVWGIDKPRMPWRGERFGIYIQDCVDSGVTARTVMLDRAWEHDELFYWSADATQLLIKQGHCIMNFLKTVQPPHPWLVPQAQMYRNKFRDLGSVVKNGVRYYLTKEAQSAIIYPWWPFDRFQMPKAIGGTVMSPRDSWFFQGGHQESTARALQGFLNGLDKITNIAGDQWLNKKNTLSVSNYWFDWNLLKRYRSSSAYVGCKTPVYWLE